MPTPRLLPPAPRFAPALPDLPTLFVHASWRNNRGNVDRSACFEFSASDALTFCPGEHADAANGIGRLTSGVFTVYPQYLEDVRRLRRPRKLRGDYRKRALAMQPDGTQMGTWWGYRPNEKRVPLRSLAQPIRAGDPPAPDELLPPNPNRGATCQKVLALDPDWRTDLRIETWQLGGASRGDPRLPPHLAWRDVKAKRAFLICPGRARLQAGELTPGQAPPLSRRPRGELSKADIRQWACYERATKLFLPLCTTAEYRDALIAWRWLQQVSRLRADLRSEPTLSPLECFLHARYSTLFPPRVLLCSQCLRLRWGQLQAAKLSPRVAPLFPKGKAPELPDPFARNIKGRQFPHNQLRFTLTRSQLKNKYTRALALAAWGVTSKEEGVRPRVRRHKSARPARARPGVNAALDAALLAVLHPRRTRSSTAPRRILPEPRTFQELCQQILLSPLELARKYHLR